MSSHFLTLTKVDKWDNHPSGIVKPGKKTCLRLLKGGAVKGRNVPRARVGGKTEHIFTSSYRICMGL